MKSLTYGRASIACLNSIKRKNRKYVISTEVGSATSTWVQAIVAPMTKKLQFLRTLKSLMSVTHATTRLDTNM